MNIRTLVFTGLLVSLASHNAFGEATAQGADKVGRYEGVTATENAVWVVDTKTGRVRKCTQEFADKAPRCTVLSN